MFRNGCTGFVMLLLLVAPAACGDDGTTAPAPLGQPETEPEPVVDVALAGTWSGTVEGQPRGGGGSAAATIHFELDPSGSMQVRVSNLPFHEIPSGSWGIVENEFVASGTDTASNTVSFRAPRSETRLQGTWTGGIGLGTFDVTKQ